MQLNNDPAKRKKLLADFHSTFRKPMIYEENAPEKYKNKLHH